MRASARAAIWPGESLLPGLPQTVDLEIYDLRGAAPDTLLSITTLAGLINRESRRIYLIENDDDEFWLQQLDPALPCVRPTVAGEAVLEYLLSACSTQIAGLVIYDPALLDTRNVASTLAALRSGLVVSPDLASRLQGEPYHFPVLADLRIYGWSSRLQAYAWAVRHLLAECSPDLFAGLDPRICGSLRSYLVTQRVFTCWLDARQITPSSLAGWYSERGLFKHLLASFHPGAFHLGWFVNEPFGIRLTSRAGLLTLASDHCTNLATWSTLPGARGSSSERAGVESSDQAQKGEEQEIDAKATYLAERAGVESSDQAQKGEEQEIDAKATYLAFTISDGDNLQYCQHHLLKLWRDPARGSLPLGWTMAPALWQITPRLAEYYRQSATAQDELIAGPSGAAYILPSYWPPQYHSAFLTLTSSALRAMGSSVLQVLDSRRRNTWFSMQFLDPHLQKLYTTRLAPAGLRGILSGAGGLRPSWRLYGAVPVYQNLGLALNPQRALHLIRLARARGIRFINIYIFAWRISPGDIQQIVQELEGDVHLVLPSRLLELIEKSRAGQSA